MDGRVALPKGFKVRQYEILDLLSSSGGFSLAYYARCDNRLYVLKEFYPPDIRGVGRDENGCLTLDEKKLKKWNSKLSQFQEEANNYQQLQEKIGSKLLTKIGEADSPGYSVQSDSGYTFFCEKLFDANGTCYLPIWTSDGITLTSYWLDRRASKEVPSGLKQILEINIQICKAVEYLHNLRRLHLDLKPDNLFMIDNLPKMLDFGSMVDLDHPHLPGAYTPGFSAPELQSTDTGRYDPEQNGPFVQSDVYSICAILYWMLFDVPIDKKEIMYSHELNLKQILGRNGLKFPSCLIGRSYPVVQRCLAILAKGLSYEPQARYETVSALRAAMENVLQELEKELTYDKQKNFTAESFVQNVQEVYAFRRSDQTMIRCDVCIGNDPESPECGRCTDRGPKICLECPKRTLDICWSFNPRCKLTCQLMNKFIELRINPCLDRIKQQTTPSACIDYIKQNMINQNRYNEALFALMFLERRANLEAWHVQSRYELYEALAHCAGLLGRDDLMSQYDECAQKNKRPDTRLDKGDFKPIDKCESHFDFNGMMELSSRIILERWGTGEEYSRDAVRRAILNQDSPSDDLVSHAGRYAEELCLSHCEGWEEDCRAILNHLIDHPEMNSDDWFYTRTVDNMLHFAIEIRDRKLFLKTLPLMPQSPDSVGSMLYPSNKLLDRRDYEKADAVKRWLVEVADKFTAKEMQPLPDSVQYILYLYLQSVNVFFTNEKYLDHSEVQRALKDLCRCVLKSYDKKAIQHPKQLILKHAALLADTLACYGAYDAAEGRLLHWNEMERCATDLRKQLASALTEMSIDQVYVLTAAALASVDRALGGELTSFEKLRGCIRGGIDKGKFVDDLFCDVLDDRDALLSCFRFKYV